MPVVEPSVVDSLNRRIEELISSAEHEALAFAAEMDEMRHRLYVVEDEKTRKSLECDKLSCEMNLLIRELDEMKRLNSGAILTSVLPSVETDDVNAVNRKFDEVVEASLHDVEVAAMELDELRHRVYDLEDEKIRKTRECDRLSHEVELLTQEVNMLRARDSTSVSMLPLLESRNVNIQGGRMEQ
ncbi:hypothetical protein TSMEX_007964, partial [Taenia solium]